ncbi:hypothetical protein C8F04DRAFT_1278257 [Mycena alexandri]|uniref:Uncharacterized protein n=1 Tax=Mycena alexandri TaxID=1745969 RepID=A0AAD6WRB3_9AGAR|nr:hypothetical protein C8F04DRAFT_1278257 [Mycena alexandri]
MAFPLADLLNPVDLAGQRVQAFMQAGLVDIRPQLVRLSSFNRPGVHATVAIQEQLINAIEYLESQERLAHIPDVVEEVDVRLTKKQLFQSFIAILPVQSLSIPRPPLEAYWAVSSI